MPYNTTAIPPRKDVLGETKLPLTRVKKIVALDPDVMICSNNAAFIMTVATEFFIHHLTKQAQDAAKLERKPRRNIQYKDVASAVFHHDNLEFLEDVIPRTAPFRQVKAQAAETRARLASHKSDPIQKTANKPSAAASQPDETARQKKVKRAMAMSAVVVNDEEERGKAQTGGVSAQGQGVYPTPVYGQKAAGQDGDVEMTG